MRIFRSYASILILILLCITASGQKIFTSGHSNFNELTNDLNKIWKGKETKSIPDTNLSNGGSGL